MTTDTAPEVSPAGRASAIWKMLPQLGLVGLPTLWAALQVLEAGGVTPKLLVWPLVPLALVLAVLIVASLLKFREFGTLAAAFLLGSIAQFSLTQDPWFPAIKLSPVSLDLGLALLALTLQGFVTLLAFWRHKGFSALRRMGAANLLRVVLLLGLLSLVCVSPTVYVAYGHLTSFAKQIVLGGALVTLHLATLGTLLLVPTPALPPRLPAWSLAVLVALVSSAIAVFALEALPHVGDEVSYLLQAQLYAQGHLTAPAPPEALRPGLEYYLLDVHDGRWIPTTAPGWPALLAPALALGLPWLINPILTGLTLLLMRDFALRSTGRRFKADLMALLFAVSPWVLATGGALMTHATALFMASLGWWCLSRGGFLIRSETPAPLFLPWALAGGLAMGWLFATRQFEGVLIGTVTGIALLLHRPFAWRPILAYGAGCILTGSLYLIANYGITGNPMVAPLADYLDRYWPDTRNAFGFGPDLGPPAGSWGALDFRPGHSPFEGAINTLNGIASLNREALGWAPGAVLALALALLWGRWRRIDRFDLFMGAVLSATVLAMFFYWFTGTFFVGPRYWYIACMPVFWIGASGLAALHSRLSEELAGRFGAVVLLLCAASLVVFLPWRSATKYHQYRDNFDGLAALDTAGAFDAGIVFVTTDGDIGPALVLNDPFLASGEPIYLKDLGPEANAAVLAAMPERTPHYVRLDATGATVLPEAPQQSPTE